MRHSRVSVLVVVTMVALAVLSGCEAQPVKPPVAATTSPVSAPSTAALLDRTVSLSLPAPEKVPAFWTLQMEIPYGPGAAQLGQADSHGGKSTPFGPEYGAPANDGSWWFLDVNKRRLAHYSSLGRFLGEIPIPGQYADLQFLHVFEDGAMWAPNGVKADDSMVSDGVAARRTDVPGAGERAWSYDDGRKAYAFGGAAGGDVATVEVVAGVPRATTADELRTPTGSRFAMYFTDAARGRLAVELPDASVPVRLTLAYQAAAAPATPLLLFFEVDAAQDGTLSLLLAGATDSASSVDAAGLVTVSPAGKVGPVRAVPILTSAADPKSASHLHIDPTTGMPSLIVVGGRSLRVYRMKR